MARPVVLEPQASAAVVREPMAVQAQIMVVRVCRVTSLAPVTIGVAVAVALRSV